MSDIVERLRGPSPLHWEAKEAADEITRLRNELHIAQEWSARVIAGHEQDIAEITALRAKNEKLRAALWDIHAVCNNWDWFIWMWPIRRIKRIARAAITQEQGK